MRNEKQPEVKSRSWSKWVLRCNYCQMHREETGGGTCPHCHLHAHYTIVATDLSAAEVNNGRRLSREVYESLHYAHPDLVCLSRSKHRKLNEDALKIVDMLQAAHATHQSELNHAIKGKPQDLTADAWS